MKPLRLKAYHKINKNIYTVILVNFESRWVGLKGYSEPDPLVVGGEAFGTSLDNVLLFHDSRGSSKGGSVEIYDEKEVKKHFND